jgi:hypothetical protein
LLATVGALLLIPAAQAFATTNFIVHIAGSGSGEVSSAGGIFGSGIAEGTPAIECSYASPGPATGTCANEMFVNEEAEEEGVFVHAVPGPGSEFVGWVIESGELLAGSPPFCTPEEFAGGRYCGVGFKGENYGKGNIAEVTAIFDVAAPSGPTNLRTLSLKKSAGGTTGTGSVSSKPKGIKCGATCSSAVASLYKDSSVALEAKPSTGSTFVEWVNSVEEGPCDGSTAPTCTIKLSEDQSLEAVFAGTSKEVISATPLTVSKGESSGKGTVKGAGLGCEADCTSTTVVYQGPITGAKPKPAKSVELTAAPAFGSKFTGWEGGGCSGTGTCVVTMNEATEVTATFTASAAGTLKLTKSSYESGSGSVASKPKGIKCGATCTEAVASIPQEEKVELAAKPSTGDVFVEWQGGDCDESKSPTCIVTMDEEENIVAVFAGPVKLIPSATALTLEKGGSGLGTVKAAGLGCEVLCTSTTVLYQGPITEPKPKPAKSVELSAVAAPGSSFTGWEGGGCSGTGTCVVTMNEATTVTATFDELE